MNRLTLSNFKNLEAYNNYQILLQRIENEKTIFNELITNTRKYVLRLEVYDGDYKGMSLIISELRQLNKRVDQCKYELRKLTNMYFVTLKNFIQ